MELNIKTIETHTEGEPTRIIVDGIGPLNGKSMIECREDLINRFDHIRTGLTGEPRGHKDMFACFLTKPCREDADFGVLYAHNSGYMDMCGHATVGVCTALVENNMVEVEEPVTTVKLDTPDGLVTGFVQVSNGRALSVTFQNIPSYMIHLDVPITMKIKPKKDYSL